ncbi:MAG: V-type ATPase subunit [Oscillospiraceae bacterium]|nr:V-type ATPase subunit [Oscillospiraceae bacterium]
MSVFKYEAIKAKCRCLYGKLLSGHDYENLLNCADVSDVAGYLYEHTAYREFFDVPDPKGLHRNKIEYYIKKSLLCDYMKMYKFTQGKQRRFINLLMGKYELEYILKIWREYIWRNLENKDKKENKDNPVNRENDDYLLSEGIFEIQTIYKDSPRIDLGALKNIATAEQFLGAIKNTDFFYIFEKHIGDDISKNYTEIETAVYDRYYKILYNEAAMFERATCEGIREFLSIRSDLVNLCRISRLRFGFDAGPEKIRGLLVFLGETKLKESDLTMLLGMEDKESFLAHCEANLCYAKKQSFYSRESMSAYMNAYLFNYHRSKKNSAASGFEAVVRYFQLKEFELQNLFYLTEGIRYQMQPDYIRKNIYGLDFAGERGRV